MFEQVTILGPGLLGASIGMAAKERGLAARVHTWSRREATRAKCQEQSWCDAVFETAVEAVVGSDLVIVCTPVETIVPLMESVAGALSQGALVTDVGSTKVAICAGLDEFFPAGGPVFIGSHPMAGSELGGLENAMPNLFEGAACMITPSESVEVSAKEAMSGFWEALGMFVRETTPLQHDRIVAHVSHLPHMLASALCVYIAGKNAAFGEMAGPGLRDTTRVAAGDAELWRQILESNRDEVLASIDGFIDVAKGMRDALADQDGAALKDLLEKGRLFRAGL
jgi:cyclohexadieny/prephenate dehydrogenase